MPFIRTITFFIFILSLFLPVLGYEQSSEYIILVSIFTFLVWVLSLTKDFISNLIAIILTVYFSQRMLMYYVFPENFSYKWVTDVQINEALIFSILALVAMVFGSMMFQIIYGRINHSSVILYNGYDKFLGINVRFEELIKMISLFVILALAIKLYIAFSLGMVVGSEMSVIQQKSLFEVILLRGSQVLSTLYILLLIVVCRRDLFSQGTRRIAIFSFVMILMFNIFVESSKGALLSMMLFFIIVFNYSRNGVSKKIMIFAIVTFLVTLFVFAAFMIWYRNIIISYVAVGDTAFAFDYDFNTAILIFSKRLGGFDWLTGIMAYQGNEFNYPGSIYHHIVELINYFVPGKVIHEQNYMTIGQGMGVFLSGKPESDLTRHLPGGLAMSYLAFGWWSFLYYGSMVFSLRYVSKFTKQFILKIILVYFFAVHHFVAGNGVLLFLSNMIVSLIITVFFIRFLISLRIINRKVIVK
jgi:hypothetical protein